LDEHPGAERARSFLAAYAQGDLDAVLDHFTEDVLWHVTGRHHLAGDYRGRDALRGYFETVRALTGGRLEMVEDRILASDRYTAMFSRVTGRLGERAMNVLMAQTFVPGPDGRWTEYFALADDQQAVDVFWGVA
jgi:ketosteroid isomerase-like protein